MQAYDEDDRPTMAGAARKEIGDDEDTRLGARPVGFGAPLNRQERHTIVQRPEQELQSVAWLYCRKGLRKGSLYQFRTERSEFGRADDNEVSIEDEFASAHHGAITLDGDEWRIHDFASTNGTFVNNRKLGSEVPNPAVLSDGDTVRIGDTELVFKRI